MRKLILIAVTLILALNFSLSAGRAEEENGAESAMGIYYGVIGSVAFALPGHAMALHEKDYPGIWKDSIQLDGFCAEDGAEFQMYTADVQGLIDYFSEQNPDGDPDDIRWSAMLNYCLFYPTNFGAEIGEIRPIKQGTSGILGAEVTYTYPDAPGARYRMKCFIEGSTATGLAVMECTHTLAALDRLKVVTDSEKEALTAEKATSVYADLYGLNVTYPCAYVTQERENMLLTACFSADFTFMEVNVTPQIWDITGTEETQTEFMLAAARKMIGIFKTEDVLNPVLTHPTETMLQLDFSAVDKSIYGDYGPTMLCRVYAGEEGFWQVMATDTDTGRAFMDSVRLTGENVQEMTEAPGLPEAGTTFGTFRASMNGLLDRDALGFRLKPGNFEWSDPICSGGKWMRILYSPSLAGAAQIIVTGTEEDAAIAEIRVLRYDWDSTPDADFVLFARLCRIALTGEDADIVPEHLDPEESDLIYERVILTPPESVAAENAFHKPEGSIPDITLTEVPAAEFESRCTQLASLWDMEFTSYTSRKTGDGSEARIYMVGDVGLIAYLNGSGDGAAVSKVIAAGMGPDDCPKVVAVTMIAYAAMMGLDTDQIPRIVWALTEYSLWSDLCDLWPLLSDGKVCAHLQEDDSGLPMGFVAGVPQ